MRNFIFLSSAFLFTLLSFGQANNPYNQTGIDLINASNAIARDYKDGKIKDVNQATIDYYYKALLPGYQTIKLADFTAIMTEIAASDNPTAIKKSKFSEQGQAFLQKSLTDYSTTALVNDVKASKISEEEKKNILIVLAGNYNLAIAHTPAKATSTTGKGPNADFEFGNPFETQPMLSEGPATMLWGFLGAVVGFYMCGPWCAVGGFIIGAIIANTGGPTTVHASGGTQYSSGYPQP